MLKLARNMFIAVIITLLLAVIVILGPVLLMVLLGAAGFFFMVYVIYIAITIDKEDPYDVPEPPESKI